MRIDRFRQFASPTWHEARALFKFWNRSRLDYERNAQRTRWKRNRTRLHQTRLQQSWHELGRSVGWPAWLNSDPGRFASISLRNFPREEKCPGTSTGIKARLERR